MFINENALRYSVKFNLPGFSWPVLGLLGDAGDSGLRTESELSLGGGGNA